MTPKGRALPVDPLFGRLPPRAPRGYVAVRMHHTQHLAKRGRLVTLCSSPIVDTQRTRPAGVCRTCARLIAELYPR